MILKKGCKLDHRLCCKHIGSAAKKLITCRDELTMMIKELNLIKKKWKYKDLFKKNYEVFDFDANLYLENNLLKSASADELDKAKDKLLKEYGKKFQEFLRVKLFRNPCIIKLLNCKFSTGECNNLFRSYLQVSMKATL